MDNDYNTLVSITRNLDRINKFEKKLKQWSGSPFKSILSLPSRTIGAVGEELLSEFLTKKGCIIQRAKNTNYDRVVNNHKCEIKFSTLWKGGQYVF